MLLSGATDPVSSGNLSAFEVIGAKCAELQAMILLPLETRKAAPGNTIILSPNFVTKAPSHLTQLIIVVSLSAASGVSST